MNPDMVPQFISVGSSSVLAGLATFLNSGVPVGSSRLRSVLVSSVRLGSVSVDSVSSVDPGWPHLFKICPIGPLLVQFHTGWNCFALVGPVKPHLASFGPV